jgi:hypothetical protein
MPVPYAMAVFAVAAAAVTLLFSLIVNSATRGLLEEMRETMAQMRREWRAQQLAPLEEARRPRPQSWSN